MRCIGAAGSDLAPVKCSMLASLTHHRYSVNEGILLLFMTTYIEYRAVFRRTPCRNSLVQHKRLKLCKQPDPKLIPTDMGFIPTDTAPLGDPTSWWYPVTVRGWVWGGRGEGQTSEVCSELCCTRATRTLKTVTTPTRPWPQVFSTDTDTSGIISHKTGWTSGRVHFPSL